MMAEDMEAPRTTRSKAKSSTGLRNHLGSLAVKSKLDEFRRFFDLKLEVWREFRDNLHSIITEQFSWIKAQDVVNRYACAEEFLVRFGGRYWGSPENREKYLMEEHLESGDFCIYPDNKAE